MAAAPAVLCILPISLLAAIAHPRLELSAHDIERIRRELKAGNPVARNLVKGWQTRAARVFHVTPASIPEGYTLQENYAPCPKDGYELKPVDYDHPDLRCPKCGRRYRGGEYDAVWRHYYHLNLMTAIYNAAHAYAVAGQEKYAAAIRPLLLWYADNYTRFKGGSEKKKGRRGFFLDNMLRESYFVYNMAVAYDLVFHYPGFTSAERGHIEQDLLRESALTLMRRPTGLSNFQSFQNSGIGVVGFCLSDQQLINFALHDPNNGFDYQMREGVVDGVWHEGSLAYHFFTLTALIRLAEAARHSGVDLYANEGLKAMFYGPLSVAWPDGTIPRVGDDRSSGINLASNSRYWEIAFARYRDPVFAWLLHLRYQGDMTRRDPVYLLANCPDDLPPGKPLASASSLLPTAGLAFLRSTKLACAVKFGPAPAWHDHFDKLELMVWALGRELGLDPGMCAQYAFPERNWYRNTIAHNCLVVDEQRYGDCCGTATAWVDGQVIDIFQGVLDNAYRGATLRRTAILVSPRPSRAPGSSGSTQRAFIADIYEASGGTIHDWVFHSIGELSLSIPLRPAPRPGNDWKKLAAPVSPAQRKYHADLTNGYEYLEDVRSAATDSDWAATWTTEAGQLRLLMAGARGTEVMAATGPGYWNSARVPLVIVRRREPTSTYFAVFEPVPEGESSTITDVRPVPADGGIAVQVQTRSGTLRVLIRDASSPSVSSDRLSTDAAVLVFWRPAIATAPSALAAAGGTFARLGGRALRLSPTHKQAGLAGTEVLNP